MGRFLILAAASFLLVLAGPAGAKEKAKKSSAAPHIYTQPECTGKKNMHWDDATQTCQKNK